MSQREHRFLARQLAMGFGAVSLVAVGMCAMLLSSIHGVSGQIAAMQAQEVSIRRGMELAKAVRELSIHIAHTVIEGDESHLAHYGAWRDQVRTHIQALSPVIPASERKHLTALAERTQRMHEVLMGEALPAVERGDLQQARQAHRTLDRLGQAAAADADALAQATARTMAHAHTDATALTRSALWGGGLCAGLVIALSLGFTLRLRAAVIQPLSVLADAARRFGRGEFDFRVGHVGRGELSALAGAFDHMADELAKREQRLLQHERMAAIGQLAAGVAHELNNPIAIIRGYLDTMNPEGDRAALRDEIAILDEEAGNCQRIAEDLLSYARTAELSLAPVEMAAFLSGVVQRFMELPGQALGSVVLDAERAEVDVDAARLRQVMVNLLHNATQMSPEGERVSVRARRVATGYQIEVLDRGPGVPVEDRTRLFEPFFTRRPGGTGLGLAVCLGIVRAHGGTIEVEDNPGGGARFVISLRERHQTPSAIPDEAREGASP